MLEEVSGFWQPATLRGFLVDDGWGASMGYPGIIPSVEGKDVEGVVFSSEALKGLWARIDAFEGDEYQRISVTVSLKGAGDVEAYVYALTKGLGFV